MTTLDELELEMYRAQKDLNFAEEYGGTQSEAYTTMALHCHQAEKMFLDATCRQANGEPVETKKTRKWLNECKKRRAAG